VLLDLSVPGRIRRVVPKGVAALQGAWEDSNRSQTDRFPSTEGLKRLGTLGEGCGCVWSRARRGMLGPADTRA